MTKTRPLKNPQDEPDWEFHLDERGKLPDLYCDDEHSLWSEPIFLFDDGIELPLYTDKEKNITPGHPPLPYIISNDMNEWPCYPYDLYLDPIPPPLPPI